MQNIPQKKRKRLGLFLIVCFLIATSAFYLVFLNFAELSSYTLRTVLEGKGVQKNLGLALTDAENEVTRRCLVTPAQTLVVFDGAKFLPSAVEPRRLQEPIPAACSD